MADPIKWRSKIILVKVEPLNAYGVDAGPTGLLNAMLLTDVQLQPMEGDDVSRNIEQAFLGAQEEFATGLRAVLTGSFELVGSGDTGVAPAWSPLLRACAVAEVVTPDTVPGDGSGTVEYMPITDEHESVSIHFYIGPTRHILLGARATGEITINAQGIPVCRVTLTGLFVRPLDQARPTVDLSKFQLPQIATMNNTPVFTINAIPFVLRDYTLNLGCDVQPRLLIGVERIIIVDKAESLSARVEAQPLAAYNPFAKAEDRPRMPVVIEHGTIEGRKVKIETPTSSQKRLTGYEQNQQILEWPLTFTPLPTSAGDDQWKITLT